MPPVESWANWRKDFSTEYLENIRYRCLVMTEEYIREHFAEVQTHANDVENRMDDSDFSIDFMLRENARNLQLCEEYGCETILISDIFFLNFRRPVSGRDSACIRFP